MVRITFQSPKRVIGDNAPDGTKYIFPFELLRTKKKPEYDEQSSHSVSVFISATLRSIWNYTDAELVRVLFEFAKREVESKLEGGNLSARESIELHTGNISEEKPFDPEKIPPPTGFSYEIDITPRIGF